MVIEFDIAMDDVLDFNLYHHQHSPTARRARLMAQFGFPLLWALIFLISTSVFQSPLDAWFFWSLLVLTVLWIILFPHYFSRRIKKIVRKMFSEGQNKALIGKHRFSLSPEAITDITDYGESKTNWSAVERIAATDKHVFIYMGALAAHIVPRRAFSDELRYKEFIETARRYQKDAVA